MAVFRFKRFEVDDCGCGMKVGTDSVLLGAWTDYAHRRNIIDLGCGSGLLALMAAQKAPQATITGVEIDQSAFEATRQNFAASPWSQRLAAVKADAITYMPETAPDLIVTNPPYFTGGPVSPDPLRAKARHTSATSEARVVADGFGPTAAIAAASRMLADDGTLAMVVPAEMIEALKFEAELHRLHLWRRCLVSTTDRKQPTRALLQFCRQEKSQENTTLEIRRGGEYTDEYVKLTEEFYLFLH